MKDGGAGPLFRQILAAIDERIARTLNRLGFTGNYLSASHVVGTPSSSLFTHAATGHVAANPGDILYAGASGQWNRRAGPTTGAEEKALHIDGGTSGVLASGPYWTTGSLNHDHTTSTGTGGALTGPVFDSFAEFRPIAAPVTSTGTRLYEKTGASGGLFYLNAANVEVGPLSSGGGGGGGGMSSNFNMWMTDAAPGVAGADDDEFDGATGGIPAGWTEFDTGTVQTVDEDEQGLSLEQTSHAGDLITGIYKTIPAGDFTIMTKVGLNGPKANFQSAGLALWKDAASAGSKIFTLNFGYQDTTMTILNQEWTNSTAGLATLANEIDSIGVTDLYLRIRRQGTTYHFEWSNNGLGFRRLNTTQLSTTVTHYGPFIQINNASIIAKARFAFFRYANSDLGYGARLSGDRLNMSRN